jgi:hypothetical protein
MYRGNRSRSTYSVTLYSFKSGNWLSTTVCLACSFSNVFPPCQRNKPSVGKTHVTNPVNKMNTCAEMATAISKRIQTFYGREACQSSTHITCQVHSSSSFWLPSRRFELWTLASYIVYCEAWTHQTALCHLICTHVCYYAPYHVHT